MALEILRHQASGEYYAVQYEAGKEDRVENISRVCGPLTATEVVQAVDEGDFANDDPESVDWARAQPWSAVPSGAITGVSIDSLRAGSRP